MRNDAKPIDATNGKFIPDYYAVYVIEDPLLGFFSGYSNHGICVPTFCNTINGAKVFDSLRNLDARCHALAIINHDSEMRKRAKLWCYKRCDFYPEEY